MSEAMAADKRTRVRLPLSGQGTGRLQGSADTFSFDVANFSVNGLQFQVAEGDAPASGDRVSLAFHAQEITGSNPNFEVTGTVRRVQDTAEGVRCGVQIDLGKHSGDGVALDHAYLERYFETLL